MLARRNESEGTHTVGRQTDRHSAFLVSSFLSSLSIAVCTIRCSIHTSVLKV